LHFNNLILVNCFSLVTIQPTMVKSYTCSWTSVSLMIISPTSRWKKVSCRCCLTMSGGVAKLIAKIHIGSMGCFGTSFVILKSSVHAYFKNSSIWIGTIIIPIKNKCNFMANITSSSSSNMNYNTLVFWFEHQVSW